MCMLELAQPVKSLNIRLSYLNKIKSILHSDWRQHLAFALIRGGGTWTL